MAERVRIIGIDPGLRVTGWGIIEIEGARLIHVADGVVKSTAKGELASRLLEIHSGLMAVIGEFAPVEAAIEETFVNKDARATLKLGQARGAAMLAAVGSGLQVAEYAPNAVKKAVIGVGHGEKSQIHAMIGHLLPRARPETDDAADALAIAITHANHRGGQALARLAEAAAS